jgi:hypothetical protein
LLNKKTLLLTAALTTLTAGAWAKPLPKPAAAHQSLMSRLMHHAPKPGAAAASHHALMPSLQGNIIGDVKTHVYHLPGDKNLPSPKNRVYFRSAAAAQAKGYRAAGSKSAGHASHKITAKHKVVKKHR